MKREKTPSSILQVARLCDSSVDRVKRNLLKLWLASPPFSYADLYSMLLDLARGVATEDQVRRAITGLPFEKKRNSYLRSFGPASSYLRTLDVKYALSVEPRHYPLGRGVLVPCAPPMVCGTPAGQVVPWVLLWKDNPMNDSQKALFISMALEVMDQDGDLDGAELVIVDTSEKALDKVGNPSLIQARDWPMMPASEKQDALEIFAQGFALAEREWAERVRAITSDRRMIEAHEDQLDLGLPPG